jgi:hypothetical protein
MIEGSGSGSIPFTIGSGSGPGGPKTYGSDGAGSATLVKTFRNILGVEKKNLISEMNKRFSTFLALLVAGLQRVESAVPSLGSCNPNIRGKDDNEKTTFVIVFV